MIGLKKVTTMITRETEETANTRWGVADSSLIQAKTPNKKVCDEAQSNCSKTHVKKIYIHVCCERDGEVCKVNLYELQRNSYKVAGGTKKACLSLSASQ